MATTALKLGHQLRQSQQEVERLNNRIYMFRDQLKTQADEIQRLKEDRVKAMRWYNALKSLPECPHDFGNWASGELRCTICDAAYDEVAHQQLENSDG